MEKGQKTKQNKTRFDVINITPSQWQAEIPLLM